MLSPTTIGSFKGHETPVIQKTVTDLSKITPVNSKPIGAAEMLSSNLERCHSSTQIEINGTHIVAFKGKQPGSVAPGIWIIRRADGMKWSKLEQLIEAKDEKSICYSPVFCSRGDGSVLLFYRVGPSPDKLTTHILKTVDGVRFENADDLLDKEIRLIGPTKTKSLLTKEGTMVFGSSSEVGAWTFDGTKQGTTGCHIELLDENGRWTRCADLQMPEGYDQDRGGAIEPTLFQFGDQGHIAFLCRNRNRWIEGKPQENGKGGWALFSVSKDNGRNWSRLEESTLRNPDTSLDIVDFGKGKLIVFYNDSHDTRHRLSFALSANGGVTWSDPCLIVEHEGEFPSAILLPTGMISVTYANKKGELNHITIDPEHIEINGRPW